MLYVPYVLLAYWLFALLAHRSYERMLSETRRLCLVASPSLSAAETASLTPDARAATLLLYDEIRRMSGAPLVVTVDQFSRLEKNGVPVREMLSTNFVLTIGNPAYRFRREPGEHRW